VSIRTGTQGVPHCLAIGRCIEVWSKDGGSTDPFSTFRRFSTARDYFLRSRDITDHEGQTLIPFSSPWSVEYLTYRGHAERVGKSVADIVAERLGRAGCTITDLPWLRYQAEALLAEADANPPNPYRRKAT